MSVHGPSATWVEGSFMTAFGRGAEAQSGDIQRQCATIARSLSCAVAMG